MFFSFNNCISFFDLHILFVDFRQAFDSIERKRLIQYMTEKGIPKKLVKLVEMTLQDTRATVMVDGRCGEEFELTRGVRQGDAMSATLFNLALHSAMDRIADNGHIVYKMRQVCAYADDVALIARNEKELRELFMEMDIEARRIGLEVNIEKKQNI